MIIQRASGRLRALYLRSKCITLDAATAQTQMSTGMQSYRQYLTIVFSLVSCQQLPSSCAAQQSKLKRQMERFPNLFVSK